MLFAILLAVVGVAGPAHAEETTTPPEVGGATLYQPGLHVDPAATPLPAAGAAAFVVADLDTGEILAAQNAHETRPPASTLKMLTAYTLLPRIQPDQLHTATLAEASVIGSKVGIVPGSTYHARNLFEGLFLISGNDAAVALADLNGGVAGTVAQMNAEAQRLQAYNTTVRNTNGLDVPGQVTTAYDLALIGRAGMADPEFARLAGLRNSTFPGQGTDDPDRRSSFEIWNQNTLVRGGYEGGIGIKPGFTSEAGRTFAGAAERDGKRYLVTLMQIEGNTYRTGAQYLDWAFANGDQIRPVGTLVAPKFERPPSDQAVLVDTTTAVAADTPLGLSATTLSFVVGLAVLLAMAWFGLRRPPASQPQLDLTDSPAHRDPVSVGRR